MKYRGDLGALDHSKGGIPETGRVNKNREALFIYDREKFDANYRCHVFFEKSLYALMDDEIDTIVVSVKTRTWGRR